MNDDRLTEKLAAQILGWKATPDRFIKADRAWTPIWRFAPLTNLEDAFDLLDASDSAYTLATIAGGSFEAEVRLGGRIGKASGEPKARTITIALARALGLELPDEGSDPSPVPQRRRNPRPRSKVDGI
jgi:hypothetical protein